MESWLAKLEPYRHLDPAGWFGLAAKLPAWAAIALLGVSVGMVLFGGGRLFRLVAAPLGVFVAAVWLGPLAARLGFPKAQAQVSAVGMVVLGLAGLASPPIVIFAAVGIPTGLLVGNLVGPTDWLLGFAPGFLFGGALGVVFGRTLGAVLSSLVGGLGVLIALLALVGTDSAVGATLLRQPLVALCTAGLVGVAGVIYQLYVRPTPEEREAQRVASAQRKRLVADRKALEARWKAKE